MNLNWSGQTDTGLTDASGHWYIKTAKKVHQFKSWGRSYQRVTNYVALSAGGVDYFYTCSTTNPITATKGAAGVPAGMGAAHAQLPNPNNRPEINAAIDLLAYLDTYGCSKASLPVVKVFQVDYNASGLPGQLTDDGEYGPNTEVALQNVMDEAQNDAGAGPSEQAPTNCFSPNLPTTPTVDVAPTTAPAPTVQPAITVTGSTIDYTPYVVGGLAAAAAATAAGIYYARKRKKH